MWAFPIPLVVRAMRCKRVGRTWPNAERLLDAPLLALCGVAEEVLIAESDPRAAPMLPVLLVVVGRVAAVLPAPPKALASVIQQVSRREWASYWATAGQLLGALQHQYPLGLRLAQDQSRRQLQAAVRASMGSSSPGV